jgi:hypothetical protein
MLEISSTATNGVNSLSSNLNSKLINASTKLAYLGVCRRSGQLELSLLAHLKIIQFNPNYNNFAYLHALATSGTTLVHRIAGDTHDCSLAWKIPEIRKCV